MSSYTIPNVITRDARGERIMDVYSHLLNERVVYLGTAVDAGVANALIAQLYGCGFVCHGSTLRRTRAPGERIRRQRICRRRIDAEPATRSGPPPRGSGPLSCASGQSLPRRMARMRRIST